jgi:hypothetical protein
MHTRSIVVGDYCAFEKRLEFFALMTVMAGLDGLPHVMNVLDTTLESFPFARVSKETLDD